MKPKKILFPVFLLGAVAALSGCGKSDPIENTLITQNTAVTSEETTETDIATVTETETTETEITTETTAPKSGSETETEPPPLSAKIDKQLENRVAELDCSKSIDRFRGNTRVSQAGMNSEEIAELLIDQNIVCYYTFMMDALVYYDRNVQEENGSNCQHYLFSSYAELRDFVYSTYTDPYAADLLSNLYGHTGELFRGDDACLLYDPSVQGVNIFAEDFSEYTCEIVELSESQMKFAVTFEESSGFGFSRIEASAVLQDGEWRLEKMFPDIQQKNPNIP